MSFCLEMKTKKIYFNDYTIIYLVPSCVLASYENVEVRNFDRLSESVALAYLLPLDITKFEVILLTNTILYNAIV